MTVSRDQDGAIIGIPHDSLMASGNTRIYPPAPIVTQSNLKQICEEEGNGLATIDQINNIEVDIDYVFGLIDTQIDNAIDYLYLQQTFNESIGRDTLSVQERIVKLNYSITPSDSQIESTFMEDV